MRQLRARVESTAPNDAAGKKRIVYCNCNDPGQEMWLKLEGFGIDYDYFNVGKYDDDCPVCRLPYWYKI